MDGSSSSSSSSSPPKSLHLAMAALVGASLMAISAFYVHKRSVDQVLQRLIQLRKGHPHPNLKRRFKTAADRTVEDRGGGGDADFDGGEDKQKQEDEDDDEEDDLGSGGGSDLEEDWNQRLSRTLDENQRYISGFSSSLPNAVLANQWKDRGEEVVKSDHLNTTQGFRPSFSFTNLNSYPRGDGSDLSQRCWDKAAQALELGVNSLQYEKQYLILGNTTQHFENHSSRDTHATAHILRTT